MAGPVRDCTGATALVNNLPLADKLLGEHGDDPGKVRETLDKVSS